MSQTDVVHSRNLATRPQLSIVIFDSTVPGRHRPGGVHDGDGQELTGSDLDPDIPARHIRVSRRQSEDQRFITLRMAACGLDFASVRYLYRAGMWKGPRP